MDGIPPAPEPSTFPTVTADKIREAFETGKYRDTNI